METKNMIGSIVGLAVVVICVAAIMMPVISDAKLTAGSEVTLENTAVTDNFDYEIWNGGAIEFAFAGGTFDTSDSDTAYTINGEASGLTFTYTQRIVLATDVFAVRTGGGSNSALTFNVQSVEGTTGVAETAFDFDIAADGTYTLTLGTGGSATVTTGTIGWLVYAVADGNANLAQLGTPTSPFYTTDTEDLIVLGNIYTTGDNDTFYAYYDGELTVNSAYQDNSSVDISQTNNTSYTDIYNTTITVNVGDESFTPYFILAPKTVSGHEASGAAYSLYSAIPVIVIAGIVIASIGMIGIRRD